MATALPALRHWGVPHTLVDLSQADPAGTLDRLLERSGVFVIAQSYLTTLEPLLHKVADLVQRGAGLLSMDHALHATPAWYRDWIGADDGAQEFDILTAYVNDRRHPLAHGTTRSPSVTFKQPVPALQTTTRSPGDATLLASEDDRPLLVTGRRGAGNIVQWYLAPCLWHSAYFGFGHGIDGLLWRGIPWAGPQPFYLHCMPPYVRYRLDDCHGHWRTPHDLSFLPPLARRGHCTSVCFCLRAIEPSAAAVLAHAQSNGTAELAPHTLAPGTSLFFGDDAGEYDDATLNRIFDELDDTATKWNVQWSSILSDHDHEWSRRAVPLLRARGITRKMNITLPGERWSGAHVDWRPAPYGSMSYALGALPGELGDFFAVFNHLPSAFDSARVPHPPTHFAYHRPGGFGAQKWDFLNGLVNGLSVDLAGAAERIDLHTRTGLDAMFFGGSISHSHFARHLTEPAWNDLLERADRATADIETVPTAYERIADYAQAHATSELVAAVRDDTTARLQLRGRSSTPLELSAFTTNEGAWQRRTIHVPPFEGGIEVTDRYL